MNSQVSGAGDYRAKHRNIEARSLMDH